MSDEDRPTTLVHMLRHGQVHNPEGILYGCLPGFHLSDLGREMAGQAANALADRDIRAVVASPMERAQETAAPVAERHSLEVLTDDRLTEAANYFEGTTVSVGRILKHPGTWGRVINPFKPSWGEPYKEQVERVTAAVRSAAALAPGREVVCVSHQLPIWVTRRAVEGRHLWHDPRRRQCTLASLTTFTMRGGEIVAVEYAEPVRDLLPLKTGRKFVVGS